MLITIQFPISDSRAFVSSDTYRLNLPWLNPNPDRDFIRSFGAIRRRPQGGLTGWLGEGYICEANHAICFQDIKPFKYDGKNSIKLKIAFKRLYFDGLSVGKFEVGLAAWGFKEKNFWNFNKGGLSAESTRKFLLYILRLSISVPISSRSNSKCQLWQAGQPLAKLYAASSTFKEASSKYQNQLESWWIQACEPVILITYRENDEVLQVPFRESSPDFEEINPPVKLSHYFIPHEGQNLRMWLVGEYWNSRGYCAPKSIRQLRIFLLRLHAERACLKQILRNISTEKLLVPERSQKSRLLQEYLNQTISRIRTLHKQSDKRAEMEIGELAREVEEQVSPGECDALLNALRIIDVEKNILRKVEDFVQQLTIIKEQKIVGDQVNISGGQQGAVGSQAHAHDMTFNQIGHQIEKSVDLAALANELATLRQAMVQESSEAEHSIAAGDVARAEQAAKSKDATKVAEYLKSAGKWTLDIASKIGVPIAIEALKRAMGIPI